jgi:hypothetical protein
MTRRVLIGSTLALALVASLPGCKDNEESFYIEHMKRISDPPECKYSTGDAFVPSITVDLAMAQAYDFYGEFQVTNALMAREDYDNLKAESNGILIDGSEVAITGPGGAEAGASEFRTVDMYLEAETTNVVPGITIPESIFAGLAASLDCPTAYDSASAIAAAVYAGEQPTYPQSYSLGSGYATVRFVGHTLGDVEVETNPFTIAVAFCCNCFISWGSCVNPCNGFCGVVETDSCAPGIDELANVSCSAWMSNFYDPFATWTQTNEVELADGGTGNETSEVNCANCTASAE